MPEIPDRVPGGVILASYANDIRDRTAQRYASAVERDSLNPLPAEGSLAYLADVDDFQVFAAGIWRTLGTEDWVTPITDALDARLAVLEAIRDGHRTVFTEGDTTLGTSLGTITSQVTAPSDGTYELELACVLTVTTAGQSSLGGVTVAVNVNGTQVESFSQFAVRHDDAGNVNAQLEVPILLRHQGTLDAGDDVQWWANRQATFTVDGRVGNRRNTIRRLI